MNRKCHEKMIKITLFYLKNENYIAKNKCVIMNR